jgi:hypothetical protein
MSDQPGPTPVDTPTPDAPGPVADTPAVDQTQIPEGYIPEDRYKEAQAWGTKASQEAAQYRDLVNSLQSDEPGDPRRSGPGSRNSSRECRTDVRRRRHT